MKPIQATLIAAAMLAFFTIACSNTPDTNQTARNVNTEATTVVATPTATPTPDELAGARATYDSVCVRCHKENGEGGVAELEDGKKLRTPSFKKGHALTHTDEEFARQIANGGDGMPAFKDRLSPEQIDALVRFVRREFQAGLLKTGGTDADAPSTKR